MKKISKQIDNTTESNIAKCLIYLLVPILLGNILGQLYSFCDKLIVGRYLGKEALAAIGGTTSNLIYFANYIVVGLADGMSTIIGKYYGSKDEKRVIDGVYTALFMAFFIGILLSVLLRFIVSPVLNLLGTPEELMEVSLAYFKPYSLMFIFYFIQQSGFAILRSLGDTKKPVLVMGLCTCLNIFLDIYFISVLNLGVSGAAYATVISQSVSAIVLLLMICLKLKRVGMVKKDYICQIFSTGLPLVIIYTAYPIANAFLQYRINSYGVDSISAMSIIWELENLFFIIVFALGASIIVFVSQNYGAKRIDRIRRCIPESIKIIFPIVLCITLILKFKSVWLISLFTTDQGVITVGADVLSFLSLWYLTYTAIEVLGNVITGCGKPHYSMITTLLFVCTLRIIYSFISIKLNFTLKQLVFAYPLSWIVNTICLAIITHKVLKELENSLENEE